MESWNKVSSLTFSKQNTWLTAQHPRHTRGWTHWFLEAENRLAAPEKKHLVVNPLPVSGLCQESFLVSVLRYSFHKLEKRGVLPSPSRQGTKYFTFCIPLYSAQPSKCVHYVINSECFWKDRQTINNLRQYVELKILQPLHCEWSIIIY